MILLHIKLLVLVHAFDLAFIPDTLEKVSPEFRPGRRQPPHVVMSYRQLHSIHEVHLLAVHFLEVINVALVVFYRRGMLHHQVIGEVGEQKALDEGENCGHEGVRIVGLLHVV